MTAELTNEQIVTNLLSSNEMLKPDRKTFYITNPLADTLGEFLTDNVYIEKPPTISSGDSKYVFIKQ